MTLFRFAAFVFLPVVWAAAEVPALRPGPHTVEANGGWTLARGAGKHAIPLAAYWPAEPGRYPVVLFSHGAGASAAMAPEMMRYWASHGYVVLLPTHRNDLTPHAGPGLVRAVKEFRLRSREGGAMWRVRVEEIGAVLDALDAGTGLPAGVHERADPERAGLGGHSFGAYTTLLVGGAVLYGGDAEYAYRDERIDAIAVLSGPGRDGFGLTEASFATLRIPMAVYAGSDDPGTPKEGGPEWRAEPFTFAPPGAAYLAFLEDANHVTYVGGIRAAAGRGRCETGWLRGVKRTVVPGYRTREANRDAGYRFVLESALVFWNAFLKDDGEARAALESGGVAKDAGALVAWSAK